MPVRRARSSSSPRAIPLGGASPSTRLGWWLSSLKAHPDQEEPSPSRRGSDPSSSDVDLEAVAGEEQTLLLAGHVDAILAGRRLAGVLSDFEPRRVDIPDLTSPPWDTTSALSVGCGGTAGITGASVPSGSCSPTLLGSERPVEYALTAGPVFSSPHLTSADSDQSDNDSFSGLGEPGTDETASGSSSDSNDFGIQLVHAGAASSDSDASLWGEADAPMTPETDPFPSGSPSGSYKETGKRLASGDEGNGHGQRCKKRRRRSTLWLGGDMSCAYFLARKDSVESQPCSDAHCRLTRMQGVEQHPRRRGPLPTHCPQDKDAFTPADTQDGVTAAPKDEEAAVRAPDPDTTLHEQWCTILAMLFPDHNTKQNPPDVQPSWTPEREMLRLEEAMSEHGPRKALEVFAAREEDGLSRLRDAALDMILAVAERCTGAEHNPATRDRSPVDIVDVPPPGSELGGLSRETQPRRDDDEARDPETRRAGPSLAAKDHGMPATPPATPRLEGWKSFRFEGVDEPLPTPDPVFLLGSPFQPLPLAQPGRRQDAGRVLGHPHEPGRDDLTVPFLVDMGYDTWACTLEVAAAGWERLYGELPRGAPL